MPDIIVVVLEPILKCPFELAGEHLLRLIAPLVDWR